MWYAVIACTYVAVVVVHLYGVHRLGWWAPRLMVQANNKGFNVAGNIV